MVSITGTTSYCSGQTISLSASGGSTYSWSGPSSFTSSNQNVSINNATTARSGIYSVTGISGACTASATISVNVNQIPAVSISIPYPLCNGSELTLRNGSSNSIPVTYQWAGVSGFTSTQENPTVGTFSSALAGIYTVTVANQAATSCSNTGSVSIEKSLPSSIVFQNSPEVVCSGGSVLLSVIPNSTLGAPTDRLFEWSGPNGFTSTAAEVILSGVNLSKVGNYTLTIRNITSTTCLISNILPVSLITPNVTGSMAPACVPVNEGAGNRPISRVQFNTLDFSSNREPNRYADRTCMGTTVLAGQTYNGTMTTGFNIPQRALYIDFDNSGTFEISERIFSQVGVGAFAFSVTIPNTAVKNVPLRMRFLSGVGNGPCSAYGGEAEDYALTVRECPPPAKITGARLYCIGQTVSLTASGGVTYSWAGPGGFTTTSANISIPNATSSQSGIYTVTVRNEFCSASTSINVVVFKPDASFTTSSDKYYLCSGKTLTLIAPAQEGVQYQWLYNNFPMVPAATSSSLVVSQAGPYTLNVSTNLCKLTATKQIYINTATPVSYSASYTIKPSKLTLTANPPGGQYAWAGPASFSSSLRSPVILNPNNTNLGIYTVTMLTPSTGCFGTATTSVLNSGASRLATDESGDVEMEVSAFPNPTSKILSVSVTLPIAEGLILELLNSQGQRMQAWEETQSKTEHRIELDIEKYKDGLYFLQVQSPSHQKTVKVWRKE